MRICSVCQKSHQYPLINTCKTCYHRNWRKLNSDKCHESRIKTYRKKHGIPLDAPRKKNKNGDGCIDYSGYKTISVKGHPNAMDSKGRIREHVYVMSNIIGRALHRVKLFII